jgi:hypothetical protein
MHLESTTPAKAQFTCETERLQSIAIARKCTSTQLFTSARPTGAFVDKQTNKKRTPWPSVRKRTMLAERPPLVGEVSAKFCG